VRLVPAAAERVGKVLLRELSDVGERVEKRVEDWVEMREGVVNLPVLRAPSVDVPVGADVTQPPDGGEL
jgi:hypothetical protein